MQRQPFHPPVSTITDGNRPSRRSSRTSRPHAMKRGPRSVRAPIARLSVTSILCNRAGANRAGEPAAQQQLGVMRRHQCQVGRRMLQVEFLDAAICRRRRGNGTAPFPASASLPPGRTPCRWRTDLELAVGADGRDALAFDHHGCVVLRCVGFRRSGLRGGKKSVPYRSTPLLTGVHRGLHGLEAFIRQPGCLCQTPRPGRAWASGHGDRTGRTALANPREPSITTIAATVSPSAPDGPPAVRKSRRSRFEARG